MNRNAILYGAGSDITKILKMMRNQFITPICITDSNSKKWGGAIDNIPIVSPNSIMNYVSDTIIITASFFDDIYANLQKLLGNDIKKYRILVAPFLWIMLVNVEYDNKLIQHSNQFFQKNEDEIRNFYNLNDSITKNILDYIIMVRKQKDYLFSPYMENRGMQYVEGYFYQNELQDEFLSIVDIGAYIGDTVSEFYSRFGDKICNYYAYEPEKDNYLKLKQNLMDKPYGNKVVTVNKALGASRENRMFGKSTSLFGVLDNRKDGIVTEVVPLDEEKLDIQGKMVIKMDVEGLELDILKGSIEYIKKFRPYMAICVYHRIEDIYEIPKFLRNKGCNYSYILRSGVHTHLIAIPN